jgi:hypothetical protein
MKNPSQKQAGGMAQGVGLEFKLTEKAGIEAEANFYSVYKRGKEPE